ncbi:hypothetical protein DFR70_102440 [Nocardia tenerifensis]|uniref:Uncharacterized protein n=1 Tax=Nocardia tenerifensis TaxID=228006 RepID=A0A318K7T5_9NOCA|nr:hypothetical protein [Nocardia tenerifensis]PXX68754.1 hypothetical protein DFR70_102440 [Nocardia tenerifensis]
MGIRATAATLGIGAGLAAIMVSAGAGQAAAFNPVIEPDLGVYGVELDHAETVALHNSALPAALNQVWRDHGFAIYLPSTLQQAEEAVRKHNLSDVVAMSADSPEGTVALAVYYHPSTHSRVILGALGSAY